MQTLLKWRRLDHTGSCQTNLDLVEVNFTTQLLYFVLLLLNCLYNHVFYTVDGFTS